MKTFGERCQEARKAKGLTLEKVARKIRSHKGYICGIEREKVNPPSSRVIGLLCEVLDLPRQEMETLAWWQKRPKMVTVGAALSFLESVVVQEQQAEPEGMGGEGSAPQKEAV